MQPRPPAHEPPGAIPAGNPLASGGPDPPETIRFTLEPFTTVVQGCTYRTEPATLVANRVPAAEAIPSPPLSSPLPSEPASDLLATCVGRASEIAKLGTATDLIARYPEAVRMLGYLEGRPAAAEVLDLHKRHAEEVNEAIERMLGADAKALRERTLPMDCLLRLTYDSGGGGAVAGPTTKQPALERQKERWEEEAAAMMRWPWAA